MSSDLTVGDLAYDTRARRVGEVMAEYGDRLSLRPVHGGCEWEVPRGLVRPATVADRLSPTLAEINARSSQGSGTWG